MGSDAGGQARGESSARGASPWVVFLVAVWLAFTAFTVVVLFDFGLIGFIEAALANGATTQVSIDLALSVVIALGFIRKDADLRGLPYWPYVVAAVLAGSIGLLAYVIHRAVAGRASRGARSG